jgi:hypothetical protein
LNVNCCCWPIPPGSECRRNFYRVANKEP